MHKLAGGRFWIRADKRGRISLGPLAVAKQYRVEKIGDRIILHPVKDDKPE